MKFYSLVLLFILIVSIKSECNEEEGKKAKDCQDKLTEDDKKDNGYSYCCYVKANEGEGCTGLTKAQYDEIKKKIKDIETKENVEIKKLDCHSLFLKFGLLNILLFLL